MSEPTIPPPSGLDLGLDLSRAYLTSGLLPPPGGEVAASLIRRCHAAESERDRLAERLRRAEELGREAMRICKASMPTSTTGCGCGVCAFAAFLAESNPTEKQA